jgi:hypothetical protein
MTGIDFYIVMEYYEEERKKYFLRLLQASLSVIHHVVKMSYAISHKNIQYYNKKEEEIQRYYKLD